LHTAQPSRTPPAGDRFGVAAALREIAALLAIEGVSPFKVRAFERGARTIEGFSGDLPALVAVGDLTRLPGIGPVLASTISEIVRTGASSLLSDLARRLPPGVAELSAVLSLPRIKALHEALGIASLAELEAACREGRVRAVKGFGEKTERRILDDIAARAERGQALLLHQADETAETLLGMLRALPGVRQAEIAGSLRRRVEVTERLCAVAAAEDVDTDIERLARDARFEVEPDGAGRASLRLGGQVPIDVRVVEPERFGAVWLWETSAPAHRDALRARAAGRGLDLTAEGLAGGSSATESAAYQALGLPYIEPELREGQGEVEAAARGELPPLVTQADLLGAVHCHTDASDGRHTLEQMARAADAMGLSYMTVTDHSPAAHYANGLSADRLRRQWDEIARVQERVSVRLLRGTECDILEDGTLDCPPALLEQLDIVVASIHRRHRMDRERMTQRIVTAMRQPWFKVWGHGLGRYVLRRPPIECDLDAVLDAIAASRAAIEVNGDPHRLDLEPRWLREARLRGIRFVASCDAHSTGALRNLRFAVDMARRAGLARPDVLNTLPVEAFKAEVRPAV
jgi:DNA polymerase (family 10)